MKTIKKENAKEHVDEGIAEFDTVAISNTVDFHTTVIPNIIIRLLLKHLVAVFLLNCMKYLAMYRPLMIQ